jgi:hypothetical protein
MLRLGVSELARTKDRIAGEDRLLPSATADKLGQTSGDQQVTLASLSRRYSTLKRVLSCKRARAVYQGEPTY